MNIEKVINSKDIKVGMLMKWSGNYQTKPIPKKIQKILEKNCLETGSISEILEYKKKLPHIYLEGINVVTDINYDPFDSKSVRFILLDNGKCFSINKNISYTIVEKE